MSHSAEFTEQLRDETLERVARHNAQRIGLVGTTAASYVVRAHLTSAGLGDRILGTYDESPAGKEQSLHELAALKPDLVVICADERKVELLNSYRDAANDGGPFPEVVVAGVGHLAFRDEIFDELDQPALVPSYATGSPHTRIHLYQCLRTAVTNGLRGTIVEFGAFKGGTTAWLARVAQHLGLDSRIVGFDTWDGSPARQSLLDLYEHPRCVFTDIDAVRAYTGPYGIELIPGDIAETYRHLEGEPLLLGFFDTDNYSPTRAALQLCADQLVVGGSLVFDHVATTAEYVYTVGERIAAYEVLGDGRFLHLHGTGVFTRIL